MKEKKKEMFKNFDKTTFFKYTPPEKYFHSQK